MHHAVKTVPTLSAQRTFSEDGGERTHRLNVFVAWAMYDDVR